MEIDFTGFPEGVPKVMDSKAKWDEREQGVQGHPLGPGPAPDELRARLQKVAVDAYRALRVRDYGRVDIRLTDTGDIYVLEVNASCYLEKNSEFAMAAAAAGWTIEADRADRGSGRCEEEGEEVGRVTSSSAARADSSPAARDSSPARSPASSPHRRRGLPSGDVSLPQLLGALGEIADQHAGPLGKWPVQRKTLVSRSGSRRRMSAPAGASGSPGGPRSSKIARMAPSRPGGTSPRPIVSSR